MKSFSDTDFHICHLSVSNPEKSTFIGDDYMHLSLWGVPLAQWLLGTESSRHKSGQCSFAAVKTG